MCSDFTGFLKNILVIFFLILRKSYIENGLHYWNNFLRFTISYFIVAIFFYVKFESNKLLKRKPKMNWILIWFTYVFWQAYQIVLRFSWSRTVLFITFFLSHGLYYSFILTSYLRLRSLLLRRNFLPQFSKIILICFNL